MPPYATKLITYWFYMSTIVHQTAEKGARTLEVHTQNNQYMQERIGIKGKA